MCSSDLDGELSEVGWHPVADLPVLGEPTRRLLTTALGAQSADFTFSGLATVLGLAGQGQDTP